MIADKIFAQYHAGRISSYFFTYLNKCDKLFTLPTKG